MAQKRRAFNPLIAALTPAVKQFFFAHAVNLTITLARHEFKSFVHYVAGNAGLAKTPQNRHALKFCKIGKITDAHRPDAHTVNLGQNMRGNEIISIELLFRRNFLLVDKNRTADFHNFVKIGLVLYNNYFYRFIFHKTIICLTGLKLKYTNIIKRYIF